MKKLLVLLPILLSQLSAFAQPPKKPKYYPPPPVPIIKTLEQGNYSVTTDENGKKLSAAGIVLFNERTPSFTWEKQNVKLVQKDSVYKITITVHTPTQIKVMQSFAGSDTEMPMKDGYVYLYNRTFQWCTMKLVGDSMTLYDTKKSVVGSFQLILNKAKNKILKLKDLNDGKIFLPSETEAPGPSIQMPSLPPSSGR